MIHLSFQHFETKSAGMMYNHHDIPCVLLLSEGMLW